METSFNAPEPDPLSPRAPTSSAEREPQPSTAPSRWDLARRRLGLMLNDKWHLDELLGVGGMAAVYAATHRNGSRVAIKLLPFSLSTGPEVCQRLLREGYLANRIAHHAVVRVLDDHIDYEREHAYLVMDLLAGETARQRFDSLGTFSPLAAVDLMLELVDCLHAAHAANVIHRDIKPENLFLTQDGLKVLDFGIARALDGNSSLTQTGTSLGTPAYMSPEQARGKQAELSVRSDIYSVGATLLFLLTGETLHTGENPMELMVKVAWTPAPSAATACPGLPQPITRVIDRCCAFEPADRYSDSHALEQALQEARALLGALPSEPPTRWSERPASVRPNSGWPREPSVPPDAETVGVVPDAKDNKRWIGVALATAAILAGGIWLNRGTHGTSSPTPALELGRSQPSSADTAAASAVSPKTPTPFGAAANPEHAGANQQGTLDPSGAGDAPPAARALAAGAPPEANVITQPTAAREALGSTPNSSARPSSVDERRQNSDAKASTSRGLTPAASTAGGHPSARYDGAPTPSKPVSANFDDARPSSGTADAPAASSEPSVPGKKGLKRLSYDAFRKGSADPSPRAP